MSVVIVSFKVELEYAYEQRNRRYLRTITLRNSLHKRSKNPTLIFIRALTKRNNINIDAILLQLLGEFY